MRSDGEQASGDLELRSAPAAVGGAGGRQRLALALVLAVACLVRALFLAQWSATPLFTSVSGDELNFQRTALSLLDPDSEPESFLYQPLYAFYLALVYRVVGPEPAAVRVLQSLLGLGTVLLFYGLGRELQGPWTGVVSAALAALYGPLIAFGGQLLAPALVIPLLVGSLWCLLRAKKWQQPWLMLPAGALLGLMVMARPEAAVLALVGGSWWLLRSEGLRQRLLGLAVMGLGLLLGVAPAALHNFKQGAGLMPVSSAGGLSFFLGNNPQATGRFFVPPGRRIDLSSHEAYRRSWLLLAEEAEGQQLSPAEVSAYWWGQGLEFIAEQPGAALRLFGRKLLLGLNREEIPIQHGYRALSGELPVLAWCLGFGVVFPFALLGASLQWRKTPGTGLLVVFFLCSWVSMAVFYVSDRYRMVLLPMTIALAAQGIWELWAEGWPPPKRIWSGLAALILGVALSQPPLVTDGNLRLGRAGLLNLLGSAAAEQGDLVGARRYFEKALALGGPSATSRAAANLGALAELEGRLPQAREHFLQAVEANAENRFALRRLALLAEGWGDREEAVSWWRRLAVLEADPAPTLARIERLRAAMRAEAAPAE